MSYKLLLFVLVVTWLWLFLLIAPLFAEFQKPNAREIKVIESEEMPVAVGVFCEELTHTEDLANGQIRFYHRQRVFGRQDDPTGWAVIGTAPAQLGSSLGQERYPGAKTLIGNLCVMWGLPGNWKSGHHYFRALHFKETIGDASTASLPIDARLQDGRHTVHKFAMRGTLLHDYGIGEWLIKNKNGAAPGAPSLLVSSE